MGIPNVASDGKYVSQTHIGLMIEKMLLLTVAKSWDQGGTSVRRRQIIKYH